MRIKNKFLFWSTGLIAGFLNGLLGTGGGMVVVPSMVRAGFSRQEAHANSVCVILCICTASAFIYIKSGNLSLFDALPYMPYGILGSVLGSLLLPKINHNILKKMFGCFSIWAAYRLIAK